MAASNETDKEPPDTETEADVQGIKSAKMSVADLLSAPSQEISTDVKVSPKSSGPSSRPSSSHAPSPASIQRPKTAQDISIAAISNNEMVAAYQYTAVQQVIEDRENIEYKLTIREQPKHSRMCGIGEKADRRPIDPAPIIQLRVIVHDHGPPSEDSGKDIGEKDEVFPMSKDQQHETERPTTSSSTSSTAHRRGLPVRTSWGTGWEDKTWYLENPYYFMYAMLADADTDEELHLLQDGKTRYTTGSCVSCLYHLKDIDGTEQGFFVFPDLSIRVEGRFRLKLCLFETIGNEVYHCRSVYSAPFNVYTAKRFPGMEESTMLSRSFADQGLKVRVRRNPRLRRGRISGKRKDILESDGDSDEGNSAEAGIVYSQRPSIAVAKRFRSNDGHSTWQSSERQPFQYHPRPPNQQTPSAYPLQGPLQQQYRKPLSPHRERRYTDGNVGSTQTFAYTQRGKEMPLRALSGGGGGEGEGVRHVHPATQQHQQQPPGRPQHQRESHQIDSFRGNLYPQGGLNRPLNGHNGHSISTRPMEHPAHYNHRRQMDAWNEPRHSAHPLPSGLPGLSTDDPKDHRTILPPLHHALTAQHSIKHQQSRPSSGGTISPRLAASFRRMPPLPMAINRLSLGHHQLQDQSRR